MTAERRVQHVPRHRRGTTPGTARPSAPRTAAAEAPAEAPSDTGGADTGGADTAGSAPTSGSAPSSGRSRLIRASALMAAGSTVSRLLGFVRNYLFGMVLAGSMSAAASAFSAANALPNTVWLLVGGGTLNAILVPAIVRAVKRPDRGSDYISRLMTLVSAASLAITAVCIVAVPVLLILTSGRLPPETYTLAIQLGYWMMPQIFFSALYVMCGQLLNAHDSFGPYQWAPVLNNLVGIAGAGIFLGIWGRQGDPSTWTLAMVIAMAAINVGGSAAQVAFLFWYVRKLNLRLRPRWGFRGLGLGKLSRIGLWTLGMLGLGQLGIWATRWSTGGAVTMNERLQNDPDQAARYPALLSLDWSYLAFMIPQGIIAVSLVTAAFPAISRHAAGDEHTAALQSYARTNRILLVPMVLCTAVFIALSGPIMWVIGGGTGVEGARANGLVLMGYMLGLVPFAALYLMKRVFYAYEDGRTPFLVQIPITLFSLAGVPIVLGLVDPMYATMTAAIISSAGNVAGWVMGLVMLRRHATALGATSPSLRTGAVVFGKLAVAGVITWAAGSGLMALLGDVIWIHRLVAALGGAVLGVVMAAVFVGVAWLLRVDEVRWLVRAAGRRLPGRLRVTS